MMLVECVMIARHGWKDPSEVSSIHANFLGLGSIAAIHDIMGDRL